jgi:single-stranded-DNA-specific exonuclease
VIGVDAVNGIGKGSGRSQPGMNLGRAVQAAWEAGVLLAGGGHAMAAGLTVKSDGIGRLRDFLNDRMAGEQAQAEAMDAVEIDALIDPGAATRPLFEQFERLAPFGPANPEPLFALEHVAVREVAPMNGGHVRCRLAGADGASVRAVAWRCADLPLGQALLAGQGGLCVAGRLKADDWNGRRGVQFEIEDVADPRMAG